MRQGVINLAHEGHRGIVATKRALRERVWFPMLDQMVEFALKDYPQCQLVSREDPPALLQMSELPDGVWHHVAVDFFRPLQSGKYILVIMNEYSCFPIAHLITSTKATTTIPVLDEVFTAWGIPKVVKTDNGPPVNGQEFAAFAKHLHFRHRKITPLWLQANGMVERFMATLKKTIQQAELLKCDVQVALNEVLRAYRTTPHTTTGQCPATLMLGRTVRTRIPTWENAVSDLSQDSEHEELAARDQLKKEKMKEYADRRRKAAQPSIHEGDWILVRQEQQKKADCRYHACPLLVTKQKGTMITAVSEDKRLARNVTHFQKCTPNVREAMTAPHSVAKGDAPESVSDHRPSTSPDETERAAQEAHLRPQRTH